MYKCSYQCESFQLDSFLQQETRVSILSSAHVVSSLVLAFQLHTRCSTLICILGGVHFKNTILADEAFLSSRAANHPVSPTIVS